MSEKKNVNGNTTKVTIDPSRHKEIYGASQQHYEQKFDPYPNGSEPPAGPNGWQQTQETFGEHVNTTKFMLNAPTKINSTIGIASGIDDAANGKYYNAGGDVIGVIANELSTVPKVGPWAVVADTASATANALQTYSDTGDKKLAFDVGEQGLVKGLETTAVTMYTPAAIGTVTTWTAGTVFGVEEVAAGTMGTAAAAGTASVLTAGGLVTGAAAVGWTTGTLIERHFEISKHTTEALYGDLEGRMADSGMNTGMKAKTKVGLPEVSPRHNDELFQIAHQYPEEAMKLSSNPELAAKGITNAQDPAYMRRKLDESQQKTANPGGLAGAWGWVRDSVGMPAGDKLVEQNQQGIAEIQLIAYEKKFNEWENSPQAVHAEVPKPGTHTEPAKGVTNTQTPKPAAHTESAKTAAHRKALSHNDVVRILAAKYLQYHPDTAQHPAATVADLAHEHHGPGITPTPIITHAHAPTMKA